MSVITTSFDCETKRAYALSKWGLNWWDEAYYWKLEDADENMPRSCVMSAEANERRAKVLLHQMERGLDPQVCILLVLFLSVIVLARARDLMSADPSGAGADDGAEVSESRLVDRDASEFVGEWEFGENATVAESIEAGVPMDQTHSNGWRTGDSLESGRVLERQTGRDLSAIQEAVPVMRDLERDGLPLVSASMMNRPLDGASPHWWQNLRQDGTQGFGGVAESRQLLFSQRDWSDWHGGGSQRSFYAHRPYPGLESDIDADLSAGPLEMDFIGFLSAEYTDNRELTREDKASGVLSTVGMQTMGAIDLTETRRLHLNLGVGVDQFVGDATAEDGINLHVTPDSNVGFDMSVGDLELRLFDRFSLNRNRRLSSFSPDAIDTGDFWSNTAGASALYPLNDALSVHGIVDYTRDKALEQEFERIDNRTITGSAGLTLAPNGAYTLGIHGTLSRRDYDNNLNNDADVASVGAFGHSPISDFTRIEVNGGYQVFDFDNGGASGDTEQLSDYYLGGAIRNELNEAVTQSLLGGHGADYGVLSNFETYDFVRYELTAETTAAITMDFGLGYRWNDESGARGARDETLNVLLHARCRLTDYWVVGVRGAFSRNEANIDDRAFDESRVQTYARLQLNASANLNFSYQRWDVGHDADGYVENSVLTGVSVDF